MRFKRLKRAQSGFIVGAVLAGLGLLVLVVAGISLANRDAAASTDKEKARLNAAVIMKQAGNVKVAVIRAQADGAALTTLDNLQTAGYLTEIPTLPADANTAVGTPVFLPTIYASPVAGVLTSSADSVILASVLSDEVCRRVNGMLYDSAVIPPVTDAHVVAATGALNLVAASWQGRQEGCVGEAAGTANNRFYFKVIAAR